MPHRVAFEKVCLVMSETHLGGSVYIPVHLTQWIAIQGGSSFSGLAVDSVKPRSKCYSTTVSSTASMNFHERHA